MAEKVSRSLKYVSNIFSPTNIIFTPHAHARARGYVTGAGVHIRECGSTLYVGLAHAVSPTNTNFRLTFLLTRLQEALYEDLAV